MFTHPFRHQVATLYCGLVQVREGVASVSPRLAVRRNSTPMAR